MCVWVHTPYYKGNQACKIFYFQMGGSKYIIQIQYHLLYYHDKLGTVPKISLIIITIILSTKIDLDFIKCN